MNVDYLEKIDESELKATMDEIFTLLSSLNALIQEKSEEIGVMEKEIVKYELKLYSEAIQIKAVRLILIKNFAVEISEQYG